MTDGPISGRSDSGDTGPRAGGEQETGHCCAERAGILPVEEVAERGEDDQFGPADAAREKAGVAWVDDPISRSVQDERACADAPLPEVTGIARAGSGLLTPDGRTLARGRPLGREDTLDKLGALRHGRGRQRALDEPPGCHAIWQSPARCDEAHKCGW